MVGDKRMIAIGVGCRRGASAQVIIALVREALAQAQLAHEPARLFSIERKRDEAGLGAAAKALGLSLDFFSSEALRAVEGKVATRSPRAKILLGVNSVSEAAALAGAGGDARLILPRIARDGVTCAIAEGPGR